VILVGGGDEQYILWRRPGPAATGMAPCPVPGEPSAHSELPGFERRPHRNHGPERTGEDRGQPIDRKHRETLASAIAATSAANMQIWSLRSKDCVQYQVMSSRPWSDFVPQVYRMDDYRAYYRRVQSGLEAAIREHAAGEIYPDPKEHCEICRWQDRCDKRRRADDNLSLVAGITKVHIDELKRHCVETTAALDYHDTANALEPARGANQSYIRVREQARIQIEGHEAGAVLHELLPVAPGFGLTTLPEPSAGDIFFDLEGDPFAGEGGLEYLFGYTFMDGDGNAAYTADWAFSREDEKRIFERFIQFVMDRLVQYPDLHIYHFAPYEPAALKRLMGRYASLKEEIDFLLRSKRFVDLYSVVRNSLRASVESYSIKKLEPLYGFTRGTPLSDANMALA
jgi:predicted RecB family nuclease